MVEGLRALEGVHHHDATQAQVIPYRFEAGAQWMGMADQTIDVEQMIRDGYLFVLLYHSTGGKGVRQLLTAKELTTGEESSPGD
jgi:hypothetical protein